MFTSLNLEAGVNKPADQNPIVFSALTLLVGRQEEHLSDERLVWLTVWSKVKMIYMWSS